MAGAVANTNMTFHGSLLEAIAPSDMYIHRIMVDCAIAPGVGCTDTYDIMINGAPLGIMATIAGVATVGAMHVPGGILINQGDLVQVLCTPWMMGSAATDAKAVVEALKIGS